MARNDQESREQSQLFAVTIRGLEFAEIRDCAAVGVSGREEGRGIGNGRRGVGEMVQDL
jgi:hypothetical protein